VELRAGICGSWCGSVRAAYREYVHRSDFASRGRKPPRPKGSGGVGPSAALRTLEDGHRIPFAHDALHLGPRRSERSPREFHHGLLGDQRNYDLLLEAGFDPAQALAIMTRNGASALGIGDDVGTIEPGKRADLVLLRGEPETLREILLVFKDGKGYDPALLVARPRRQDRAEPSRAILGRALGRREEWPFEETATR